MKKLLFVLMLTMLFTSSAFGALAKSRNSRIGMGNAVAETWELTFTSVTGAAMKSGLSWAWYCAYSPSTSDDHGIVYKNSATASTTEDDGGWIYVDGVTSNDTGDLLCIGLP